MPNLDKLFKFAYAAAARAAAKAKFFTGIASNIRFFKTFKL